MKKLESFQEFKLSQLQLKKLRGGRMANCGCVEGASAACTAAGYRGEEHQVCYVETIVECIEVFPSTCSVPM